MCRWRCARKPSCAPNLTPHSSPSLPHAAGRRTGIRILLVICRPGGRDDVPFRSVASRIIKGLTDEAREHFQLDVLRPPTFEQLSKVLRDAKAEASPITSSTSTGTACTPKAIDDDAARWLSAALLLSATSAHGKHGYLPSRIHSRKTTSNR